MDGGWHWWYTEYGGGERESSHAHSTGHGHDLSRELALPRAPPPTAKLLAPAQRHRMRAFCYHMFAVRGVPPAAWRMSRIDHASQLALRRRLRGFLERARAARLFIDFLEHRPGDLMLINTASGPESGRRAPRPRAERTGVLVWTEDSSALLYLYGTLTIRGAGPLAPGHRRRELLTRVCCLCLVSRPLSLSLAAAPARAPLT